MTLIDPSGVDAVLVRADDAELLGSDPSTMLLLADGDTTGRVVSAIRTKLGRATDGASPHYHARAPEMFFIIEGGMHILVGDHVTRVNSGDFLIVPPNTAHVFRTTDDTGVDMLFLMPGVERFDYFRLVDRVRREEADLQEVVDTQERFDNHFHDSPVWSRFLDGILPID